MLRSAWRPFAQRLCPPRHPSLQLRLSGTRWFSTAQQGEPRSLRSLMSKYGRSALILYFSISTIDLALCFVTLRYAGNDTMLQVEEAIQRYLPWTGPIADTEAAETAKKRDPGIVTTFAVAYAVHKLLVPIRVPLTAAFTPMFAKWMIRRGWMKPVAKKSAMGR